MWSCIAFYDIVCLAWYCVAFYGILWPLWILYLAVIDPNSFSIASFIFVSNDRGALSYKKFIENSMKKICHFYFECVSSKFKSFKFLNFLSLAKFLDFFSQSEHKRINRFYKSVNQIEMISWDLQFGSNQ